MTEKEIREFIQSKIIAAGLQFPPVTLVYHDQGLLIYQAFFYLELDSTIE